MIVCAKVTASQLPNRRWQSNRALCPLEGAGISCDLLRGENKREGATRMVSKICVRELFVRC